MTDVTAITRIDPVLLTLNEREEWVIRMYYGIGMKRQPYIKIARKLGRENGESPLGTVETCWRSAIAKLREPSRLELLKPFLQAQPQLWDLAQTLGVLGRQLTLDEFLGFLRKREEEIIRKHNGLDTKLLSLNKIAADTPKIKMENVMDNGKPTVTRERVRQIERRALAKLRLPMQTELLTSILPKGGELPEPIWKFAINILGPGIFSELNISCPEREAQRPTNEIKKSTAPQRDGPQN